MRKIIALVWLLVFNFSVKAQEVNFDTVKIKTVKVADHIYMLQGSGGNIGVLTGPEGILMIDDQFAPLSAKITNAIKSLDSGRIRFVINTHLHGDHSGGNVNFKKAGATIVAHDQVRTRMISALQQNKQNAEATEDALPLITFNKGMNFYIDNEEIELLTFDPGHTDGDVFVHFKTSNVYHAGDAYVRYGYPYIDISNGGSVSGFITTLDKFLLLLDDNSRIIPGHGEVATKADVKKFRDTLADLRDQVLAAFKRGKKPEEISGMPFAKKYDKEWGGGFLKGKDFVLMMAENLKPKKKS